MRVTPVGHGGDDGNGNLDRRERSDGLLTTGDMARMTRNTLRTVRFYEEAGILRPDRRSAGGHRLFGHRELERLQFISDMRAAGLSLDAIRQLLDLKLRADSGCAAAGEALVALDAHLEALAQKTAVFLRLQRELGRAREVLQGCCSCHDNRSFPHSCDGCDVLASQGELPQSMRVMWALAARR